jgi:outer membrane biogenesis lipoprotein LolB
MKIKIIKLYYLLTIVLFASLTSCGGLKTLSGGSKPNKNLEATQLIQMHEATAPKFKTLAARLQVKYQTPKESKSITVSLRMEKDKKIWIKASILGVTIAKVLITPNKVQYYETISNTYFDGDFRLLSNWIGTDLDFKQAQNLLLGQAIFDLKQPYDIAIFENKYKLEPKQQLDNFVFSILFNPANFKVNYENLSQPKDKRMLTVFYEPYTKIGDSFYPSKIKITSTEEEQETNIFLTYKKIDVNAPVGFPFTIPNGYEEIHLN